MIYCIMTMSLLLPLQAPVNGAGADCAGVVTMQFPDGSYYRGGVDKGLKDGSGIFVSADGSEYHGGFLKGQPHGTGIFSSSDGRRKKVVYDRGTLVESRLLSHDSGDNGAVFGEFECLGRYTGWYRGNKIRGFVPHGRGIMRYFNGSIFSGQWVDGKMHGNGTVQWEDGASYSGQWVHGKRTGYGTYIWPNGDTYVGGWKDNQMFGKGTLYYNNGTVERGIWKEKKLSVNEPLKP